MTYTLFIKTNINLQQFQVTPENTPHIHDKEEKASKQTCEEKFLMEKSVSSF